MSAALFYLPFSVAAKPTNIGAPGARAYFYIASSTTLRPVYSTSALTAQLSNPVVADGLGRFPPIYLNNALSYKLVIKDKLGTTLFTADPYVPGTAPDAGSLAPYQAAAEAAAADAEASASDAADNIAAAVASTLSTVQGYVASAAASAIAAEAVFEGTAGVVALPRFTPEMYGAVGNNAALDAPALHSMGVALSALGRGAVDFYPGRTYLVGGGQVLSSGHQAAGYAFPPIYDYVLDINGCTGPVVVNMNGATIKCANGVKYGTFNDDGTDKGSAPGTLTGGLASPYNAMIRVNNCTGQVAIRNGELDGNIANFTLGGYYGTNGRQIDCDGLCLTNNAVAPIVEGLKSHHQGRDDIFISGPGDITLWENGVVRNCGFLSGGRGNSFVAGNGWLFENCRFNDTGQDIGSMSYTGPGCGLDLEAETGNWIKNVTFKKCEFVNNASIGVNAPVVTSAHCSNIHFDECRFIGTTDFAAWVYAPYVSYDRCLFVGSITGMYPSPAAPNGNLLAATQFKRCRFECDEALSPTGDVYQYAAGLAAFFDWTYGYDGIAFDQCLVRLAVSGINPTAGVPSQTRWRNSTFRCEVAVGGGIIVGGLFEGQDTYFHNISTFPDPMIATARFGSYAGPAFDSYQQEETRAGAGGGVQALARYEATGDKETGKRIYRGSTTYNPPSLATGAKDTIQTMTVTGVALGDKVEDVSFSVNLAGARIHAWVSAANTVSYYAINENGANPLDLASGTLLVKVRQT